MQTGPLPRANNSRLIIIFAACLSLTISWLYISETHVLSPDSLLYIFTAQTFIDHGLQAAIDIYPWPLLSILISAIHQITGLSLVLSGHLLIAGLYAGLSCIFILLVRDLGGSVRAQLLALLVISIFPTLNDYRGYITRDAGFWLLTLLSLQQLLHFALRNHFKHALGWFLFTLAAIGFRTEALFFAVLSPLALLSDTHLIIKERLKKTATLYSLFACVALLGLLIILVSPQLSEKFRLVTEIINIPAFFHTLANEYGQTVDAFANIAPHEFSANDMGVIIATGLIGLVIYTLSHALTLPYLVLLGWAAPQPLFADQRQKRYLISYLLIITLYLLLLSFKKYFMTDRFCIAAVLILMLALPFCIERAWLNARSKFDWRRILIVFCLLIPALDSLISSGSSKKYIAEAAEWVQQHKSPEKKLFTNHKQIAILGANCWPLCVTFETSKLIKRATLLHPELLAIRLKNKDSIKEIDSLLTSKEWTLVKTFSNEKDDKVLILSHQSQTSGPL